MSNFLSIKSASDLLGVSTKTLRRWECEIFATEVIIINRSEDSSFEEDLAKDVLEIITVFSARLYGSRSHKNKQIVEQLKEVAKNLE